MEEIVRYTLSFLLRDDPFYTEKVGYTADKAEWPQYALVIVPSAFFSQDYGTPRSLPPAQPALLDGLPVPYGQNRMERYAHAQGETLVLHADFVAAAYFMLSRYEEWMRPTERDAHGRFPGRESWAARAGCLDRPLVDEYGLWLKARIDKHVGRPVDDVPESVWHPGLKRIYLTHDIDAPFLYQSAKGRIRSLLEGRGWRKTFAHRSGGHARDPYDTFATVFALDNSLKKTLNKNNSNPVVQDIYFIKSRGKHRYDKPRYRLGGRALRGLRDRILRQGATIGLHISYTAGGRPERIGKEKRHLEKTWGVNLRLSRHHFLRFQAPSQIRHLAENGLTDDFTMGFADTAGFRLGTARPVRAIDPAARRLTAVTYHPLLCMDSSLFDAKYMHLDEAQARQTLHTLLDRAHAVGGEACLLWHNTSFMHDGHGGAAETNTPAGRPPVPGADPIRIAYDTPRRLYADACTHIAHLHCTEFHPHLRILLLCDMFPPDFAPRMGYLVHYLKILGHSVTVVTESMEETGSFAFLREDTEVHACRFPSLFKAHFGLRNKKRTIYDLSSRLCANRPFDLLLCSTYRTFPLSAAARLARRYDLPWMADLRDLIEQYPDCGFIARPLPDVKGLEQWFGRLFGLTQIQKRNRLLRQADALSTISPWHTELLKHVVPQPDHVAWIANGYDPDLYAFSAQSATTFDILYTGRLISTRLRDPSLLLQAVEKGRHEQAPWAQATRLVFYSDRHSQQQITELAARIAPGLSVSTPEKPDADAPVQLHDYIASNELPKVMNHASVLLVLTNRDQAQTPPGLSDTPAAELARTHLYRPWRWFFQKSADRKPQGVLTTKLFEALGVEKPILCIRNDHGPIAALLRESGQGLAADTVAEVEEYLQAAYTQWKTQGYTHTPGSSELRTHYRRDHQARQFEHCFFQLLGMDFVEQDNLSVQDTQSI